TPMFEDMGVFERVGESTDIVRKEMYDFHDKGGRHLALRPEGTASVVRAYVQHRPVTPFKTWYVAPNFRYESPQAGRYRQHDQLCGPCQARFERVREGLDAVGIPATIELRLVRGLDYYTRTTFEFAAEALESAQNAVGGGGRYDGLAEALGGPPTPGIGFGTGIERILLACDAERVFPVAASGVDVFVIDTTGGEAARDVTAELRAGGVSADRAFDNRSWKA